MHKRLFSLWLFLLIFLSLIPATLAANGCYVGSALVPTPDVTGSSYVHRTFFSQGRYWVIYWQSSPTAQFFYTSSIDGCSNWATPAVLRTPVSAMNQLNSYFNGTHLLYVYGDGNGANFVFNVMTPASNGVLTAWSFGEIRIQDNIGGNIGGLKPMIGQDSTGLRFYFTYTDTQDLNKLKAIIYSFISCCSLSVSAIVTVNSTNAGWSESLLPLLKSDRVYLLYASRISTGQPIQGRLLFANATLGSVEVRTSQSADEEHFAAISLSGNIYLAFTALSSNLHVYTMIAGVWSGDRLLLNMGSSTTVHGESLSILNGKQVYLFFTDQAENIILDRVYTVANSSWSPQTNTVSDESANDGIYSNQVNSVWNTTRSIFGIQFTGGNELDSLGGTMKVRYLTFSAPIPFPNQFSAVENTILGLLIIILCAAFLTSITGIFEHLGQHSGLGTDTVSNVLIAIVIAGVIFAGLLSVVVILIQGAGI